MKNCVAVAETQRADPRESVWRRLVSRMAEGQQAALSDLYDQSSRVLYALALRVVRRAEDADEVIHDVYSRAWKNARSYDPARGSVLSWLALLTRSIAIDRLRSSARHLRSAHSLDDAPEPQFVAPSQEDAVFSSQRRVRIRSALRDLPAKQGELIESAFFDGLSHAELSDRYSLPLGTVKARIRTGLLRLRLALEDLDA